jgi:phage gp29-like protein
MLATADQRRLAKQTRFNPLRTITPAGLATALDSFETGWLRSAALIWETIERRVPIVCNAAGKRKRSISRRPWEVITTEKSAAADKQKEEVEYLFNHLTARDALRGNLRGGMSTLIKQMMNAPFHRYANHELAWKPSKAGITVECSFVPLWFFTETTGELRFTGPLYQSEGEPLKDGEWMVTCGDGIMEAISVAWMFHKLSLEDWVNFSERFGTPGVLGRTKAAKDSPEGEAMREAVSAFGTDFEGVIYGDDGTLKDALSLIESSRTGDQPFEPMVARMERTIVALCRGADLGTISSKEATGASLQEDETNLLEEDDCEMISETLQNYLVLPALRYHHGAGVEPLVKIQITPSATTDVAQEIATDTFLIKHGVRIAVNDLAERYGRTQAEEGEEEEIASTQASQAKAPPPDKARDAPEAPAANSLEAQLIAAFTEGFTEAANTPAS